MGTLAAGISLVPAGLASRRWTRISIWLGICGLIAALAAMSALIVSTNWTGGSDLLMRVLLVTLGVAFALGVAGIVSGVVALARREGWTALAGLGLGLAGVALVIMTPAATIFATYLIRG